MYKTDIQYTSEILSYRCVHSASGVCLCVCVCVQSLISLRPFFSLNSSQVYISGALAQDHRRRRARAHCASITHIHVCDGIKSSQKRNNRGC